MVTVGEMRMQGLPEQIEADDLPSKEADSPEGQEDAVDEPIPHRDTFSL